MKTDIVSNLVNELCSPAWEPASYVSTWSPLVHDPELVQAVSDNIRLNYDADHDLKDGLSRLAYLLWGEGMHKKAQCFWHEDISSKRISWWQYLKYADTLAEQDKLSEAVSTVEYIYDKWPDARGGFSGLAWRIRNTDPETAERLFERDIQNNRISEEFSGKYALFLNQKGQSANAMSVLSAMSHESPFTNTFLHKLVESLQSEDKWDDAVHLMKTAPFPNWFKTATPCVSESHANGSRCLFAFYDMFSCPPAFNFAVFLGHAEAFRLNNNYHNIHVVIVPATPEFFPSWYPLSQHAQHWRLHNLMIPCASMLPSCSGITICESRDRAVMLHKSAGKNVFPHDYTPFLPTADADFSGRVSGAHPAPYVEPSPVAMQQIQDRLSLAASGRHVVTITLRETNSVNKDRNSNIPAWTDFVRSIDQSIFCPVILRDQDKAMSAVPEPFRAHNHLPEAVWDLSLRAALYRSSIVNLGVNNGPMMFCLLDHKSCCLVFKITSPGSDVASVEFIRKHAGIEPGEQLSFMTPRQRFVWKDDTVENISAEFNEMVTKVL